MQPENLTLWIPIFRDIMIVLLATFILFYQTVWVTEPNPYLIGAALTLLGAPAAIRVDALRRKGNGEKNDDD